MDELQSYDRTFLILLEIMNSIVVLFVNISPLWFRQSQNIILIQSSIQYSNWVQINDSFYYQRKSKRPERLVLQSYNQMRKQAYDGCNNAPSQTQLQNTIKKSAQNKQQHVVYHPHQFVKCHHINEDNTYGKKFKIKGQMDINCKEIDNYNQNLPKKSCFRCFNSSTQKSSINDIYNQYGQKKQFQVKQKERKVSTKNSKYQTNLIKSILLQTDKIYRQNPSIIIKNSAEAQQLAPQQIKLLLHDTYLAQQQQNIINSHNKCHKHAKSSVFVQQDQQGNIYNISRIKSETLLTKSLQACVKKQQLLMKKKLFDPYKYFSKSIQGNKQDENQYLHSNIQKYSKFENIPKKVSHRRWPSVEEGISVPESARMHSRQLQSMFKVDSQNQDDANQEIICRNEIKQFVPQNLKNNSIQKFRKPQGEEQKEVRFTSGYIQKIESSELKNSMQENFQRNTRKNSSNGRVSILQNFKASKFKKSSMTKASSLQKQYETTSSSHNCYKSNNCSQNNSMTNSIDKSIPNTLKKQQRKQDYSSLATKNSLELMKIKMPYYQQTRQSPKRHVKQNKQNYYKVKVNQINQMQKARLKLKITRKK